MARQSTVPPARRGSSAVHDAPRPLRRDAELNLARILIAARDVFAELGYDASMEQIAARADVGVGTLYRRFPHKSDLLDAVVDAATQQTKDIAAQVLAEVAPADAVFEFLRRCVAVPSCWRATIARPPRHVHRGGSALAEVAPFMQRILERSQDAGTVRGDIAMTDLVVTLMSVRAVADLCDARAAHSSRRFLELALDGLRPGHRPPGHAPMTTQELSEVLAGR
jgi:AcrR family transcriptional regulator